MKMWKGNPILNCLLLKEIYKKFVRFLHLSWGHGSQSQRAIFQGNEASGPWVCHHGCGPRLQNEVGGSGDQAARQSVEASLSGDQHADHIQASACCMGPREVPGLAVLCASPAQPLQLIHTKGNSESAP